MGFSLVVEELAKSKKPLVGHNMFFDMLFLYQQFIAELPPIFADFIESFSSHFPAIYDTKCISSTLGIFNNTTLTALH